MSIMIRAAQASDAQAITELLAALDYPNDHVVIGQKIETLAQRPDAGLFVAESQGEVAGFISLHFIPQIALAGDFCRISYLCISPTHRRLGIGRLLMEKAEALAQARQCDRMELHSHARRTEAHSFYTALGYEESPKYLVKRL